MCGRYKIVTDAQALYDAFQVGAELDAARLERYNVAPATDQLVVLEEGGRRVARWHHWGLIPSWAKDKTIGYKTINARGESVAAKPAFRAALRQRRCLVPATGFYEWKVRGRRQAAVPGPAQERRVVRICRIMGELDRARGRG